MLSNPAASAWGHFWLGVGRPFPLVQVLYHRREGEGEMFFSMSTVVWGRGVRNGNGDYEVGLSGWYDIICGLLEYGVDESTST